MENGNGKFAHSVGEDEDGNIPHSTPRMRIEKTSASKPAPRVDPTRLPLAG
jgi:hypothetical protein